MAISMVRKPSETPNITNIDDIIPFRYAYGNQSGYVISRGAEVSHTVNGNQFTVNSGRIVIQGVESDIDANGITLTIDSVSETRYYAVYHEINLATNTSNIKVEFDTATYPNITEGDDLIANSSGIARLVLYNFIAQNGVISGVEKVVKAIQYTKDIQVENAKTVNGVEIKKDNNGVLRFGDIIIPQKKLLFSSDEGVTSYTFSKKPKKVEIVFGHKRGDTVSSTIIRRSVTRIFDLDILYWEEFLQTTIYASSNAWNSEYIRFSLNGNVLSCGDGYRTGDGDGSKLYGIGRIFAIYEIID